MPFTVLYALLVTLKMLILAKITLPTDANKVGNHLVNIY